MPILSDADLAQLGDSIVLVEALRALPEAERIRISRLALAPASLYPALLPASHKLLPALTPATASIFPVVGHLTEAVALEAGRLRQAFEEYIKHHQEVEKELARVREALRDIEDGVPLTREPSGWRCRYCGGLDMHDAVCPAAIARAALADQPGEGREAG